MEGLEDFETSRFRLKGDCSASELKALVGVAGIGPTLFPVPNRAPYH